MKITFRACGLNDLMKLRDISYHTYDETFHSWNTPENMETYLKTAFDIDKISGELSNTHSEFYFIYADEILAGYLKLNESEAQTEINDPESLEIERIYITKEMQGKKLGAMLLKRALTIAIERNKTYVWLGVWEKNEKAIQFYTQNGFFTIDQHSFFMGEDEQIDFIMKKDLTYI